MTVSLHKVLKFRSGPVLFMSAGPGQFMRNWVQTPATTQLASWAMSMCSAHEKVQGDYLVGLSLPAPGLPPQGLGCLRESGQHKAQNEFPKVHLPTGSRRAELLVLRNRKPDYPLLGCIDPTQRLQNPNPAPVLFFPTANIISAFDKTTLVPQTLCHGPPKIISALDRSYPKRKNKTGLMSSSKQGANLHGIKVFHLRCQ